MTTAFSFFGGVDFSGAKEPLANLWTAVGAEVEGRLRILSLRPHAFRKDLAYFVVDGWRSADREPDVRDGRILWGVDFPFGLPSTVTDVLGAGSAWASIVDWVADRPADEVRKAAGDSARLLRKGDVPGALAPLDLRLFKQTVEGLRWLQQVLETADVAIHPQQVTASAAVSLMEVYPSGTAREIGLPGRRAPSKPGEARARAAALRTFLDFDSADTEMTAVTLEDAWDATIACLTAYLCREDLDQPFRETGQKPGGSVSSEGWIYRPPAALTSVPTGRRD